MFYSVLQVMVFVHARGETVRTARWLQDQASQRGHQAFFEGPVGAKTPELAKRVSVIVHYEVQSFFERH